MNLILRKWGQSRMGAMPSEPSYKKPSLTGFLIKLELKGMQKNSFFSVHSF